MMGDVQLAGAVVVVTGAGGGIGAATARLLSARGARVVAVDRDASALDRLAAEAGAVPVVVDLRDPSHAEHVAATAHSLCGRIDAVVANAGVGHAGEFAAMEPERIEELLDVNVRAPMLLARAVLPGMLTRGAGALVFVSSIAGSLRVPRETVYSATKAAIDAFAEPLREELLGTGVAVSTIVPAVVDTRFFDKRGEPYDRRFPRPVPPDRLAAAVLRAIATSTPRQVVPRWLGLPIRLRGIAPGIYRRLARRFG